MNNASEETLFSASNGVPVGRAQFQTALDNAGLGEAKVIYLHTSLRFGTPNPRLRRSDMLDALSSCLLGRGDQTLVFPTYTFSFCNDEVFDVDASATSMGAINEYLRKRPDCVRSVDPLLSVGLIGKDKELCKGIGKESIGKDSTFDLLRRRDGVRFLFLGVRPGDCFTYMHHLEWVVRAPYRYDRAFEGVIRNGHNEYRDSFTLFVRYHNVTPGDGSYRYEEQMIANGSMKRVRLGDAFLYAVDKDDATEQYLGIIKRSPNFFITQPFDRRIADSSFVKHKMTAL